MKSVFKNFMGIVVVLTLLLSLAACGESEIPVPETPAAVPEQQVEAPPPANLTIEEPVVELPVEEIPEYTPVPREYKMNFNDLSCSF